MKIQVKTSKGAKAEEYEVDIPNTLAALLKKFGEESVVSHAKANYIVAAQSTIRTARIATDEKPAQTQKQVQDKMLNWKPGVRKPAVPASEKVKKMWAGMSPEMKAELLRSLKAA